MFGEDFMRDFFNMPRREQLSAEDVRRIVREELQRACKVGCRNFAARDGRGFCRNCGYHHDEH